MRTPFKIIFLIFLPFCVFSQEKTFRSSIDHTDSINLSLVVDKGIRIELFPRIYSDFTIQNNELNNTFLVGKCLAANFSKKTTFISAFDYLGGDFNYLNSQFADSLSLYFPAYGMNKFRWQFNLRYKVNKFITADLGNGKQFIGNGYRSLLLSANHSAYPFLKLTTKFGRVKYYNLYTTFVNPNQNNFGRKKHSTIHFLDFEVADNIHFGVFESILWQSKSAEVNKGFEFAYLNPVIFYRPVEFSKHSSKGNALMGANFKAKFCSTSFYGQVIIDDMNISRQRDNDEANYEEGFFQNKFGFQLGARTKYKGVDILAEYNQVQPYTYGHRTILQNYSHMNQSLAHPLGANFKEVLVMTKFTKDKWNYSLKIILTRVGLDSLGTHYGQNIFESDYAASTGGQYSYGNFNGQGVGTTIIIFRPEISYKFKWITAFANIHYQQKKSDLIDQTSIVYSFGLRTFPFESITDY